MPKIECIEDVIMANGKQEMQQAFTKGNIYRTYPYILREVYETRKVTCAKNNWGERHIIKDTKLDEFFNKHFVVLK